MQTDNEVDSFLEDAGWGAATRVDIAADFSSRLFSRLTREEDASPKTAILMRADSDHRTDAFVHIAALLRRLGLAAPDIYASDVLRDLVLMEDFGDASIARLIDAGQPRDPFDAAAAHTLAHLHSKFEQRMFGAFKTSLYNAALFTDQATLFLDHYCPRLLRRAPTAMERSGFVEAWHDVLSPLDALPRSLVLRDFMPDNAMVLAKPVFGTTFGLLDFQDAGLGPVAYDIASWCEEVRRDGGLERLEGFVAAYHAINPAVEEADLLTAARVYAAQRHVRILGRLIQLDKPAFTPRVWKAFQFLMKDEALMPVRRWFVSCTRT